MRTPPFAGSLRCRKPDILQLGVTGHTVTGLQEGRAYLFRVTPLGVGTDGEPATLDAYTPLRGPSQVTATKTAPWQATLAWQPSPSPLVTGYDVYCSVNGDLWRFFDEVDAQTTGYRFASAIAGNIAFAVRARGDGWWDGLGDGYTGSGNTGGSSGSGGTGGSGGTASGGGDGGASAGGAAASDLLPGIDPATGNPAKPRIESAAGTTVVYGSMIGEYDDFTGEYWKDFGFTNSWSPAPDLEFTDGWWFTPGTGATLTVGNLPPHQTISVGAAFSNLSQHTRFLARGKISVAGRSAETPEHNWPWEPYVGISAPHTGGSATIELTTLDPEDVTDATKRTIFTDVAVSVHTPKVSISKVGQIFNLEQDGDKATFRVTRTGPVDDSLFVFLKFQGRRRLRA